LAETAAAEEVEQEGARQRFGVAGANEAGKVPEGGLLSPKIIYADGPCAREYYL
jgi:hypothetical protein